ncbi:glycosyltransferase family 4 protein [Flavobacterium silvaticum]|uniref:Glycosyltransferase family 4 protein n=1 Tax=Flavobacterium silvaticum TaxID=1852020 RepID=A0A972FNV6_9FLAO|nr:glycosyltransferase family 4 protein [Flavobacterium silvaticum]NMH29476.1 glycosyltransferase family 4 protein [Flavobacterium silvaticum]
MRTVLIAHNYSTDSFAAMSHELAHYLARQGFRVIFVSHRPYFKEPFHANVSPGEVIVYSWPTQNRPGSMADFYWFAKLFNKYKPQNVIGHFVGANIVIPVAKILSLGRCKTIGHYHTIHFFEKSKSLFQRIKELRKRVLYHVFCDTIVCPSAVAQRDLKQNFNYTKTHVLLNPLPDRFKGSSSVKSQDTIILVYLGRMLRSKGVEVLLKAFGNHIRKFPQSKLRLTLAGPGQKEEIESMLTLAPTAIYDGVKDYSEIDSYLRTADFVILPSLADTLPLVGVEALMNKVPLLISTLAGISEYLEEDRECLKFYPDVDSIQNLLERVELESFDWHRLQSNSRLTYKDLFSMESYCAKFLGLLS